MQLTTLDIVHISNEYYFIVKDGVLITPVTKVEQGSTAIVPVTEGIEIKIADTLEDIEEELLLLGFAKPTETNVLIQQYAPWHIEQCAIRVYMDSIKYNKMIREVDGLYEYFKSVGIPFVEYDNGGFLYLNEIFPQHEELLNSYGATIEHKTI